jgi:predicted TIM-barrel fold metal-dependent hydrolase
LLEWCITKDIPVLVHSGYGEFEARRGYGEYHSDPEFWQRFLESHSTPAEPCKLRLCLGHAGGEDYWFGRKEHADWGRRVYELCARYPNVYCEVTTSDTMIEATTQAFFVDRIATLFAESAGTQRNSPHGEIRYPFAKKMMYGTDWPLPDQGEPNAVLIATEKALLHPSLRDHYADYFSLNARRYLKLAPQP